ncbi:hypothetical protein AKJ16_DCAP13225 [Drosera capensis]
MKIEIPEFEGKAHPDEFIDWMHTVERVFDLRNMTEDQKVKVVTIKLRKYASIWWEHVKKQRAREGKPRVQTWEKMKKLLRKKIPPCALQTRGVPRVSWLALKVEKQNKRKGGSWKSTDFRISSHQRISAVRAAVPVGERPCQSGVISVKEAAVDDGSWLRNNIFHTKRTSGGKVCSMIIDGGSCENVVSTIMVEKLGLKTKEHPQPYKLSWLKRGYDVKYDRQMRHDGFKNTYTFTKDDVTITLGPSDLRKDVKGNLLSRAELVIVEQSDDGLGVPAAIIPLLDEFFDVVPKDLPSGLPPMRDIQHCIDFVPGASIPNKAAYRLSPKEYEESQRLFPRRMARGGCALLVSRYHQIRMRPGDEWKTTFKTRDGFATIEQHLSHLRMVFGVLRKQKLYANVKKCHVPEICCVQGWSPNGSSEDCLKDGRFAWNNEAEAAFQLLKQKVTEAEVLILSDFNEVFEGDSNNSIIFCCFPGRTNNAIRPNRSNTSPDVSLCCCCFPGESSYPSTSLPNRVLQQDQKRDGFCARVRKVFSRKQSSDQSMPSNPPPGKILGIPHPSGDYPMDGRYNLYPFPAEKYPVHGLCPTSIHEVPPRNHPMDSVYPPFRRQEVYPPRNQPAEGIYPPRNHPMDGVFPPFHKQEVHPPRNHPAEVVYPPTKMPEFSRNQMEDHYPPIKMPEVPPRNHPWKEAVGGDSEEKAGKQGERTAYEELDMLRGGQKFEGRWFKNTMHEDRESIRMSMALKNWSSGLTKTNPGPIVKIVFDLVNTIHLIKYNHCFAPINVWCYCGSSCAFVPFLLRACAFYSCYGEADKIELVISSHFVPKSRNLVHQALNLQASHM